MKFKVDCVCMNREERQLGPFFYPGLLLLLFLLLVRVEEETTFMVIWDQRRKRRRRRRRRTRRFYQELASPGFSFLGEREEKQFPDPRANVWNSSLSLLLFCLRVAKGAISVSCTRWRLQVHKEKRRRRGYIKSRARRRREKSNQSNIDLVLCQLTSRSPKRLSVFSLPEGNKKT